MENNARRFGLVSYVSGDAFKSIRSIQKELAHITGSRKCVEDWLPHITLGNAVALDEKQVIDIDADLKSFVKNRKSIKTFMRGFGGIAKQGDNVSGTGNSHVIFVSIELGAELQELWDGIREHITSKYDAWSVRKTEYIPHITLAFFDLTEDGYRKGMDYLSGKPMEGVIDISHIALVECYGERVMTSLEHRKFYFED